MVADGRERAAEVRRICCQAIQESHLVVVDLDSYGLDSAWEIGYAEALGVRVVGVSKDFAAVDEPRIVHKREYLDNLMHGWDKFYVSEDLEEVASRSQGKVVHVCCPFENETAMLEIGNSAVTKAARRVIFPKDVLDPGDRDPREYSWRTREEAVRLLREADLVLTVLPRYGMDTAWKLGYAAGLEKETIGWLTEDLTARVDRVQFFDHWMHGWKQKFWVTDLLDLVAFVHGLPD